MFILNLLQTTEYYSDNFCFIIISSFIIMERSIVTSFNCLPSLHHHHHHHHQHHHHHHQPLPLPLKLVPTLPTLHCENKASWEEKELWIKEYIRTEPSITFHAISVSHDKTWAPFEDLAQMSDIVSSPETGTVWRLPPYRENDSINRCSWTNAKMSERVKKKGPMITEKKKMMFYWWVTLSVSRK